MTQKIIAVKKLAELLKISYSTVNTIYLRHYTLSPYVSTVKDEFNPKKYTYFFKITPESVAALEKFLLNKKKCFTKPNYGASFEDTIRYLRINYLNFRKGFNYDYSKS